jgi:hypothetical protein
MHAAAQLRQDRDASRAQAPLSERAHVRRGHVPRLIQSSRASCSCRVRRPKPFSMSPSPSYLSVMVTTVEDFRVREAWGTKATTAREVGVRATQRNRGGRNRKRAGGTALTLSCTVDALRACSHAAADGKAAGAGDVLSHWQVGPTNHAGIGIA